MLKWIIGLAAVAGAGVGGYYVGRWRARTQLLGAAATAGGTLAQYAGQVIDSSAAAVAKAQQETQNTAVNANGNLVK